LTTPARLSEHREFNPGRGFGTIRVDRRGRNLKEPGARKIGEIARSTAAIARLRLIAMRTRIRSLLAPAAGTQCRDKALMPGQMVQPISTSTQTTTTLISAISTAALPISLARFASR